MKRLSHGFTIIELMIVVVIIAILTSVAVPGYKNYMYKSRRADAKAGLASAALAEEKWRANNISYTATIGNIGGDTSPDGYYTLSVVSASSNAYQLQASPTGVQADDQCGSFRIDQNGTKTLDGNYGGYDVANCW